MIEEKEVKTWWAYLYNNEEYDDDSIVVGELLDHHPKQGPLHWQAGLFEVVQKSEFDSQSQLLKEKEETIQSLQKSLFGRSAHADVMEHKATRVNALLSEKEVEIANLKKALNHAYKQYSLHITTFAGNHIPMVAKLKKECEALAKGDAHESV